MDTTTWTYGAEHEWGDWDARKPLPMGFKRDDRDTTIVNSNGVANDPSLRYYPYGGEINTPPSHTVGEQIVHLRRLKQLFPDAVVNHRSNLHLHIRVPGLKDSLHLLKRVQAHVHEWMPRLLPHVEPLPKPRRGECRSLEEFEGAVRRWKRRRVSHQTLLTADRLKHQLAARTVQEFFEREVPHSLTKGPQWQCQPRLCVNLRQLRETDTVEFRHFPGTLDEDELWAAFEWVHGYLQFALDDADPSALLKLAASGRLPRFPQYVHWREEGYRLTVHDGTISREDLPRNIAAVALL